MFPRVQLPFGSGERGASRAVYVNGHYFTSCRTLRLIEVKKRSLVIKIMFPRLVVLVSGREQHTRRVATVKGCKRF
jgi:hypothetical protein